MLRTDKPIYKVILVLNIALIGACLYALIHGMITTPLSSTISYISLILKIVSLVFALVYMLYGYRKNVNLYYKGLLATITLLQFINVACLVYLGKGSIATVISAVMFGLLLVLTIGNDLGKTKSLVLTSLLFILQAYIAYRSYFVGRSAESITSLTSLEIICLAGIMTYAKYLDKAERGTK